MEELIIKHCAPTLWGLKAASLFAVKQSAGALRANMARLSPILAAKNLRLKLLCQCSESAQILIYRESQVQAILDARPVQAYLRSLGYTDPKNVDYVLGELALRMSTAQSFPHEIGLVLSYPLEDVVGFTENAGRNFVCKGCWKVYGNPQAQEQRFALYTLCSKVCRAAYLKGLSLRDLSVTEFAEGA